MLRRSQPRDARDEHPLPSVRLHPPPLPRAFIASYGEMSRRSGDISAVVRSTEVEAAEEPSSRPGSPN